MTPAWKVVPAVLAAAGLASWGLIRLGAPPPRPAQPAAAVAAAAPAPVTTPGRIPEVPAGAARPYDAAPPRQEWLQALAGADAARGEQVMREGLDRGQVQACTSCHGINGEPVAGSNVPRLSGQSAYYLLKQLHDYQSGARRNPIMSAYTKLLTPQQMADLALAWAGRGAPYAAPAPGGDGFGHGGLLFAAGDPGRQVAACYNCHGLARTGADQPFPYIGGQHPDYTLAALQDWVDGRRANDAGSVMRAVVAGLTPDDRRAIAAYLATLQPPGVRQP